MGEPARGSGRSPESRRRSLAALVVIPALLLAPGAVHAQNGSSGSGDTGGSRATGRIEGSVVDGSTGEPLIGGQVVVAAANLGTVTRSDGTFFIDEVPEGSHRVTSEYLGYRSLTRDVEVIAGKTVEAEFALPTDVVQADMITAKYEKEPMRPRPTIRYGIGGELELPARVVLKCDSKRVLHGMYIENGRWSDQASVEDFRCDGPLTGPRPRGVIPREDAEILTEEQKAQFAERGYLIRGYNDADFR